MKHDMQVLEIQGPLRDQKKSICRTASRRLRTLKARAPAENVHVSAAVAGFIFSNNNTAAQGVGPIGFCGGEAPARAVPRDQQFLAFSIRRFL